MARTNSILFKKTNREIVINYKQFLAIILIAALAICLYTGLIANYKVLEKRVNTLYDQGNIADIWTTVKEYNEDDYQYLKNIDNVENIEKRFVTNGSLLGKNVTAIITENNHSINKYASISEGVEGFLLDEKFGEANKISIGDQLVFTIPISTINAIIINSVSSHEELNSLYQSLESSVNDGKVSILSQNTLELKFKVTGFMIHPENIENGAVNKSSFLTNDDYFYQSLANTIEDIYQEEFALSIQNSIRHNFVLVNQYIFTVDDKDSISNVKEEIDYYFQNNNRLVMSLDINNLPSNSVIQSDIIQAMQLTLVFPVIFFLVAILVILTTISQIILRERIQIGTMKAIGLTNKQILFHYISLSVVLCLIGSIIGVIIGPLVIPIVMNNKYEILYTLPAPSYIFPVFEITFCILTLILIASLVSYLVCRRELSLTPSKSMRPKLLSSHKKLKVRNQKSINRIDIPTKMAFRNIRLNYSRSIMVILGVLGCTALLVCGFGIDDTLNHGANNDMENIYSSDIMLTYHTGVATVKDEILEVEGVSYVEEFAQLPATLVSDKVYSSNIYIIEDDSKFFKVQFSDEKIAISKKIANKLDVNVGDKISFTVLGNTYTGEIGVIFDIFYAHGIYVNIKSYPNITNTMNAGYIDIDENADAKAISDKLREIPSVAQSSTHEEIYDEIMEVLESIRLMTLTIKVFAILLAVIVLYNLALLNYKERSRDIATLKVLGFKRKEIAKSLFIEIMVLSSIGAFIGLLFGMPVLKLVLSINETPIAAFLYNIKPISYLYSISLTLGTSIIVNIILSNFTDKIKMVESLKLFE